MPSSTFSKKSVSTQPSPAASDSGRTPAERQRPVDSQPLRPELWRLYADLPEHRGAIPDRGLVRRLERHAVRRSVVYQELSPQTGSSTISKVVRDGLEVAEVTGDQSGLRQHHDVRPTGRARAEGRGDVVAEWHDLHRVVQLAKAVEDVVERPQLLPAPAHRNAHTATQSEDVTRTPRDHERRGCSQERPTTTLHRRSPSYGPDRL